MNSNPGGTTTLWHADVDLRVRPPLTDDGRADVCVVGAGIAGMMTAYLLAREGRHVVVLDDGPIGGGETGRTTAHLSDALDDRYTRLASLHGADGAMEAAASHRAAIELIATIAEQEQIDCDFAHVAGYLFAAGDDGATRIADERNAARRAGVAVDDTTEPPCSPFGSGAVLRFANQARVHPLKLLDGLARCIERDGGRIHSGTHVTAVEGGSPVRVSTDRGHTVLASSCVVATNSPISDYVVTHMKQAPYRTFAIAARVPSGSVPDALYWEDADPYIYIRVQPGTGHDWLIVGGEDYKTGQQHDDDERLDRLVAWTRKRFPVSDVGYRWSGQVLEPADGLAFIGPNPDGADNIYIATGDSGHGMTHGAIAGMVLTDLIAGRASPWAALYDPRRVTMRAGGELAKENLNVAAQYADWVRPADATSGDDVPAGSGRVVRRGARMIAIYRSEQGELTERSAACTHLKCVVQWNDLEKSWDCPCHGSRFAPNGDVLNGPALTPLPPLDGDAAKG